MSETDGQLGNSGLQFLWIEQENQETDYCRLVAVYDNVLFTDRLGRRKARAAHETVAGGADPAEVMRSRAKRVPVDDVQSVSSTTDAAKLKIIHQSEGRKGKLQITASDGLEQALVTFLSESMGQTVVEEEPVGKFSQFSPLIIAAGFSVVLVALSMQDLSGINTRGRSGGRNVAVRALFEPIVDLVGGPLGVAAVCVIACLATLFHCLRNSDVIRTVQRVG